MHTLVAQIICLALAWSAIAPKAQAGDRKLFSLKRADSATPINTEVQRPFIVQFWATWCKNCGETMAFLDKHNQADFKTEFYTVAVDDESQAIEAYLKQKLPNDSKRMLAKTFIDTDAKFAAQSGVTALPHIVVMDPGGKILLRHIGHPDNAVIESIRKLVAAKVAH